MVKKNRAYKSHVFGYLAINLIYHKMKNPTTSTLWGKTALSVLKVGTVEVSSVSFFTK